MSCLIQSADRELAYLDAWGPVTKKRAVLNVATAPENVNYHRHTPEGARDYKLLQKKLANFKMGNYTSLKKLQPPEKGFGGPQIYIRMDW